MAKRNKVEMAQIAPLSRVEQAAEFKRLIAEVVDERVKAAMSGPHSIFEPWFGSKEVAHEIKRRQTVAEQRKFVNCYAKHGCAICSTKSVPHGALAMCERCYHRLADRLKSAVREHSNDSPPNFSDGAHIAQEALARTSAAPVQALPGVPAPRYRTHTEAAREAGVNAATLYSWIEDGKVQRPATKIGKQRWLWTDDDIERLKSFAASEHDGRYKAPRDRQADTAARRAKNDELEERLNRRKK